MVAVEICLSHEVSGGAHLPVGQARSVAPGDSPAVQYRGGRVMTMRLDRIVTGDSPRPGRLPPAHIMAVAERAGEWDPLLITPGGRIVDGHYRYMAARRLGRTHLGRVVFDGTGIPEARPGAAIGTERNVRSWS